MPSPGEMYGGRYRLDERIAAGGMGEVWRGTDTVLGRDVAVKTLHADRAGDPNFQTRFRNEARAMAALHHPGVADVYDFGETEGGTDAFIVMARVEGEPLHQRIAARGRLSADETLSVVSQAGRALEAAHRAGIVHRDVKPGNLIIKPDGTVVLVDFGVARQADTATMTAAGEVVGTAMYIAPEQVSKEPITPAVDVYALGVVAYHCLAGQPPFLGDNPVAIAMQHLNEPPPPLPDDVPPAVQALVLRAMAKRPEDRFASAAAMAGAADQILAGVDTTTVLAAIAPPAGTTAALPARQENARGRKPLIAAAAAVLVLAAAALALALTWPDDEQTPPDTQPSATVGASAGTGNAPARTPTSTPKRTSNPAPSRSQQPVPATTRPSAPVTSTTTSPSSDESGPSEPETSAPPETTAPPEETEGPEENASTPAGAGE
ncbi:protein kinase [Actinoplanes sp. NPDC048796]|uniref:serine/threonine-protein kinase n=1 Tax=Actinoplanes sp. NPDC048796 TaxID=3155640 RepID=UPI0033C78AFD